MPKAETKSVTITARITPSLAKKLAKFAKTAKRTRSQSIEIILEEHIDYELEFVEAIAEGIRSIEEGRAIPSEEVFRRLRAKSARLRAARKRTAA